MIYNMLTLSIQLLLIGFLVGVVAYFVFPQGRSQVFLVELTLSVLGAFLGTILEVFIRSAWALPIVYHIIFQFLVPFVVSVAFVVIYRLANGFRD
jgi:uncharacterized membrane protein YeaQ/YmgE (transglycosylase-associated protein family)